MYWKIFAQIIYSRPNNFSATSGIKISIVGSSVVLKNVVSALSSRNCGKSFNVVLKFGNGLSYKIYLEFEFAPLPGYLQGRNAFIDIELKESKGKQFSAHILSIRALGQTFNPDNMIAAARNIADPCKATATTTAASQGPAGLEKKVAVSKDTLYTWAPRRRGTFSQSFLVHKCITALAKEQSCCLPLTSLLEKLDIKAFNLDVEVLIDICLENAWVLQLIQDSSGEKIAKLKPVGTRAAVHLIKFGWNVTVMKNNHQPVTEKHDLAGAWVSEDAIILDGLHGLYYKQETESTVVLSYFSSELSVPFPTTTDMEHQLSHGMPVTVCLKISTIGGAEVHVYLLSLTVPQSHGKQIKVFTAEGKRRKILAVGAVCLTPASELHHYEVQREMNPLTDPYKATSAATALQGPAVFKEITPVSTANIETWTPRRKGTVSQSLIVLKCVTVLAKEHSHCLPFTSLHEKLNMKIPYVDIEALIDICLENAAGIIQMI